VDVSSTHLDDPSRLSTHLTRRVDASSTPLKSQNFGASRELFYDVYKGFSSRHHYYTLQLANTHQSNTTTHSNLLIHIKATLLHTPTGEYTSKHHYYTLQLANTHQSNTTTHSNLLIHIKATLLHTPTCYYTHHVAFYKNANDQRKDCVLFK
jgi:hypothetical protein